MLFLMVFPASSTTWILLLPPGRFQDLEALACCCLSSATNGLLSLRLDSRVLKDQRPCSLSYPVFPYAPNSMAEHVNNGTLPRYECTDLSISVNT